MGLPDLPEGEVPVSYDKPFQRHPLCTCPDLTWDAVTGRAAPPDLAACRARAFGGIDPHPVLDAADLRAIVESYGAART